MHCQRKYSIIVRIILRLDSEVVMIWKIQVVYVLETLRSKTLVRVFSIYSHVGFTRKHSLLYILFMMHFG